MLDIIVYGKPATEKFDEDKNEFVKVPGEDPFALSFEHSLVSLSKWESKWEIPFLSTTDRSPEQTLDYLKLMIVTPEFPPEVFDRISQENVDAVSAYINAKMTATWFNEQNQAVNREIITSEIIYYWMIALQIPFECQHWHLNRLLALIKVVNLKNAPEKKMSAAEANAQRHRLNEERRRMYNTKG